MWAGGKTKMIKFYDQSQIMPLEVERYIEPFFGGGAMFVHVMERYRPKAAIINDINPSIVNIYQSIKTNLPDFLQHLNALESSYIPLSKEDRKKLYYDVRQKHAFDYQSWSSVQEAATLYFLMKTGFNGIWQCNINTGGRFGTPSGLLNQKTNVYDVDTVTYWHNILQNTTILNTDWRQVVQQYPDAPSSFYFMDPPYRGSFTSYNQTITDQDQSDMITFARSVSSSSRVMLCNDDVGDNFFQNQCGHLSIESYDLKHTAGRRKKTDDGFKAKSVKEIVLHNYISTAIVADTFISPFTFVE